MAGTLDFSCMVASSLILSSRSQGVSNVQALYLLQVGFGPTFYAELTSTIQRSMLSSTVRVMSLHCTSVLASDAEFVALRTRLIFLLFPGCPIEPQNRIQQYTSIQLRCLAKFHLGESDSIARCRKAIWASARRCSAIPMLRPYPFGTLYDGNASI